LRLVLLITLSVCLQGCVSSAKHEALNRKYADLQQRYDSQVAIIADQEEALQALQRKQP